MGRVVLLGLDGATWQALNPLLDEGRLPHLARLAQEGGRGPLRSIVHPLTPAAWTSVVTGLNPGKHGIYDFRRRRAGSYALELVNGGQRDGDPLWVILNRAGRRCGIFNVPMTYPPDRVDGFLVSGMDTPSPNSMFTYPPSLRDVLLDESVGHQIDLDGETLDVAVLLDRLDALARGQQRALDALLDQHRDLDLLMAVFVATDRLYHVFWKALDPTHSVYDQQTAQRVRQAHEGILRIMDESVGRLRAWAGEDATFIVMSDHGFGPLDRDVYMNRFLRDAGLLHVKESGRVQPFAQAVDWSKTRAYSFGYFGNIYLNLRGREPEGIVEPGREAERIKDEISAALMELCDPETGQRIADRVYRREELYSGPHVEEAPDLLVVMRDYAYMTRDGYENMFSSLVGPPMSRAVGRLPHTGNHRMDGILLMAGPGIAAGRTISGATLLDIAPTALYALGLPVPNTMDGHVLRAAYDDDYVAKYPPRRVILPTSPSVNPTHRQVRALAQQVDALEAELRALKGKQTELADYAAKLEGSIAEKNAHITRLEALLQERERELGAFQRSPFYRLYQRWQRLRGAKSS